MVRFLLITGLPYSGKTTLKQAFQDLGVPAISVGDLAREEAKMNGMTPPEVGEWWRKIFGPSFPTTNAAKVLYEQNPDAKLLVVEGLREVEAIPAINKIGPAYVLACLSPYFVRLRRMKLRGREGDTLENFIERNKQEMEWGVVDAINEADVAVITKEVRVDITGRAKDIYTKLAKVGG